MSGPERPVRQANIGGPRQYTGAEARKGGYAWDCPACGAKNVGALEAGCPTCGSGTTAQAEAAAAAARTRRGALITHDQLVLQVVGDSPDVAADYFLTLEGLTPAARVSIMAALAHYADHGAPSTEELPRQVLLGWAQYLRSVLLPEL